MYQRPGRTFFGVLGVAAGFRIGVQDFEFSRVGFF